jgi:subtilase family serine protease
MRTIRTVALVAAVLAAGSANAGRHAPSLSPRLGEVTDRGRSDHRTLHRVVVGLELRNRDVLDAFLAEVHDPASPNFGRFLSPAEAEALFAPVPETEERLVAHLTANGLTVTERAPNRLLVAATGSVGALERAFGVEIHDVALGGRLHYAAVNEPTLPGDIADHVVGVLGLDDLGEMRSHARPSAPVAAPNAALGTNCCHLSPNDLATFYDDTAGNDGTGQTIAIAGAYAWSDTDVSAFNSRWGLPGLPAGSGQICVGSSSASTCNFSSQNSIEIALDVEYTHGTAPGARILNYMAASTSFADFATMYNRIVTDNPGHSVTTSWGACEAGLSVSTQQTNDNIFAYAVAVGQSWFAASGDNGSRDCSNVLTVDHPANSPRVSGVGGTTPTCSGGMTSSSPACAGYGSERGWSGSGGGMSQVFSRPSYQTGCGVPAGTTRLVPDVALESDTSPGNYVAENGVWYIVGGTSGAAPQWAGFFAELNQRVGGTGLGNPGPRLYGLCGTSAFHDVTLGSNGDYSAGAGYDLVTGLGTIEARNFLNSVASTTTTTSTTATTAPSSSTTTVTASSSTSTSAPTTSTTSTTASSTTTTTHRHGPKPRTR